MSLYFGVLNHRMEGRIDALNTFYLRLYGPYESELPILRVVFFSSHSRFNLNNTQFSCNLGQYLLKANAFRDQLLEQNG